MYCILILYINKIHSILWENTTHNADLFVKFCCQQVMFSVLNVYDKKTSTVSYVHMCKSSL